MLYSFQNVSHIACQFSSFELEITVGDQVLTVHIELCSAFPDLSHSSNQGYFRLFLLEESCHHEKKTECIL